MYVTKSSCLNVWGGSYIAFIPVAFVFTTCVYIKKFYLINKIFKDTHFDTFSVIGIPGVLVNISSFHRFSTYNIIRISCHTATLFSPFIFQNGLVM